MSRAQQFIDGLKSLVSSIANTRNATVVNQIVSTQLSYPELNAIYKTGVANKIVRVKTGYALNDTLQFTNEQDKEFYDKVLAKQVKQACNFMLAFGRGIIVINEHGADLSTPSRSIPEKYKLDIFSGDMVTGQGASIDLADPRYQKPEMYSVRGFQFHYSRVIDFRYVQPVELELPQYQYGGISEFELIQNQLTNDAIVERASATIIDKSSSFFYKIKGFKETLASGNESKMLDFYRTTENSRSIFGAGLIDAEDDVTAITQTLTGLKDVDQITLRRLAMVTGIPVAILIGESVRGLNATGDTEKEVFNEMIWNLENDYIKDPVNELMLKLGKHETWFKENQNQTPNEMLNYEKIAIENATLLAGMGEDSNKYLLEKGVIKKDTFEEFFEKSGVDNA